MSEGWVYFAAKHGKIKIGCSANPLQRAYSLRKAKILALIPGDRSLEKLMHSRFSYCRYRGEWFRRHATLLEYIRSLPPFDLSSLPTREKGVVVKIDKDHYDRVVDAAKAGTRSVAHQLRVILNLYFKGEAQ